MRLRNLLLIISVLFSADCGGSAALDTPTTSGGSLSTGGNASAGASLVSVSCCGTFTPICTYGTYVGTSIDACPPFQTCHEESQSCGGCPFSVWCSGDYTGIAAAGGSTGSLSVGGAAGTGCTGNFEAIQSNTGLCVAKMVPITAPSTNQDYSIDLTEVTVGQYAAWLATNPALPAGTDANCGYVTSYAEQGTGYTGADADHHAVASVDWCDAYSYCRGVGKRLCGAIGGGSYDYSAGYDDATRSQWYRACSSGGTLSYPYGNIYQAGFCDGADLWKDYSQAEQTVVVGSLMNCVTSATGYAGVYDLSGNVWEWEDSCVAGQSARCHVRGGSFWASSDLTCGYGDYFSLRNYTYGDVGFRCCSQ